MLMATQGPGVVVGITAMMLAFDFAAVAMRFKARRVRSQPLKADDWLALFALVSLYCCS
jgi:hypothetical protein